VIDETNHGNNHSNYANVGTANVYNFGGMSNYGTIEEANVSGYGWIGNEDDAIIGTANVAGDLGRIDNNHRAFIGTANISVYGVVYNSSTVGIGTVDISDQGMLRNAGARDNAAVINVANVSDNGRIFNGFDGWYGYERDGTIGEASIQDNGQIDNFYTGTIGTLFHNGGTVNNIGTIDHLTYTSGTYDGRQAEGQSRQWSYTGNGSIGTLTLAGNSASNTGDWGIVENLKFDGDGGGILSITGFADDSFDGIRVTDSVNLANGGIFLDMSAFGAGSLHEWETAYFGPGGIGTLFSADLFGTSNVDWSDLAFFDLAYGGDTMRLFDGTTWYGTWGITADGLTNNAEIPEPATLAIVGLGLAGLGWARRRRK